jgi:hypothetical protein
MSWAVTAVVGSAVIGSYGAKKAAKEQRKAQQYAADKQSEGFDFYKPYLEDVIDRGQGALDSQIATGAFTSPTYARMNPLTTGGLNYANDQAVALANTPANFMGVSGGFADNFGNLYNRAADLGSDGIYGASVLNDAVGYGSNSPQAQAMVDSIMRDDTRRLNEQTLPTLARDAAISGNTNSSKNAVAAAIAQRGYDDRRADVGVDVADRLTGRYIDQRNTDFANAADVNTQLGNVYNNAYKMIPQLAAMRTGAGNALQAEQQAIMNDQRRRFEEQRDYEMNTLNAFNAGILNQAVRNSPQNPVMVSASPNAAAIGGAMSGAGFGLDMYKSIKSLKPTAPATPKTVLE